MSSVPATTDQLVADCQGLVRTLARKAHLELPGNVVDLDDLIGYGQVGLSEAARAYDPSRGVKFSTFAYYRVRGAIYDGVTLMAWFRKSPRPNVQYNRLSNELLDGDSGDSETVQEDSRWMQRVTGMLAIAYLASNSRDEDDSGDSAIADPAASTPDFQASDKEIRDKVRGLIHALPGQEGILMRAAYYEGLTLKQSAERIGISKAWASRLHAKTLKRLAHALRGMGIDND
jgi:RNA polymerase sigma factor for flagellar operon FliA